MNFKNALTVALKALAQNKIRSILTSIGIIIGVSSVIIMIGIGNSARIVVENNVKNFGTNAISVYSNSKYMSSRDIENIKKLLPDLQYITPVQFLSTSVKNRHKNHSTHVYGVNNSFFRIKKYNINHGRLFTEQEIAKMEKVAIIGSTIRKELYGYTKPLNKTILIKNIPFKIIGSIEEMGNDIGGRERDNIVIIPYTTASSKLLATKNFKEIYVATKYEENIDQTVVYLQNYIKWAYQNIQFFNFSTSKQQLKIAQDITGILALLLVGIASISLFVGGVGIMNIMLVSVTERTREIGIRMAIGAKKNDILMQFIIESITLCLLGGIAGIVIGMIIYFIIIVISGWPFIFSAFSILISFCIACSVGIFFGLYPARKASNLLPIEALRHE